ncbi:hypothetical protein TraAM80_02283 [Trypanosoma rangeli]|uniref:Uncharacterized protein n=1 Tax=Trypanosoma rangeli TaxID=5698 RepID=A0A422NUW5_TRYRA|nr:uncharacterized protein TraAM80_02283 [Trypanosoma rangeli]RNF09240.1 hypothetical protein TraAM80_02283 [Trypanosoma rangeli]|eukprot:RNF09240.1 hypothetical protein TraAM80_02283 [Trypanosoma rangeli]
MSAYGDSFEGSDTTSSQLSPSPLQTTLRSKPDTVWPQSSPSVSLVPVPVPVQQAQAEQTMHQQQGLDDTLVSCPDAATSTLTAFNASTEDDGTTAGAPSALLRNAAARVASINLFPKLELSDTVMDNAAGQGMEAMSDDTTQSNIERKLGGLNASNTEEFKALASYVAFGPTPPMSMDATSLSVNSTKKSSRGSVAIGAVEDSLPTKTLASAGPVLAEADGPSSWLESSVFSTLSQHLAVEKTQEEEPRPAAQLKEAVMAAAAPPPPSDVMGGKVGGASGAALAMLPLLSPQASDSQTQSASSVPPMLLSKGPQGPLLSSLRLEGALTSLPPPLPLSDPRQNPKIVELRETSEAVERLVRAFALLRGHVASSSSDPLADAKASYTTKDTEQLSSFRRQHGVGDAATMRVRQANGRRPYLPRPNPVDDAQDANKKAALQLNEAAVEDAIMCLVMELMQRDAKQPFEENKERRAIHPSFEVVDMDNFKSATPLKPHKSRRSLQKAVSPFSVFDGEMQAFAPGDADASESLYNSVFQGLQKYVWSHVAASTRSTSSCFPPVSAHFAWVLQLDLLLVCMQTLETRFAGECAGTKGGAAVWIQYEGSREAEPLARNAAHCLPFEALDAKQREKPVFRLEYWVTKEKMWTVVEALTASIREGVVARSDGYRAFSSEDDIHIDPNALLPTRVPLFSLVAPERLGASDEDGRHNVRKGTPQNEQEETNTNFFHIHTKALELLAHAVSTTSTELLESDIKTAGKHQNYKQRYQDATTAVTEAVYELLGDAGIRAAVQRRATVKLTDLAKRREVDNTVSQQQRERRLIEAAEEEAERVVKKILQEIRVEEARDT